MLFTGYGLTSHNLVLGGAARNGPLQGLEACNALFQSTTFLQCLLDASRMRVMSSGCKLFEGPGYKFTSHNKDLGGAARNGPLQGLEACNAQFQSTTF